MSRLLIAVSAWFAIFVAGGCAHDVGSEVRSWTDVEGVEHRPLDTAGDAASVLIFLAVDCPISNAYAPEISRIVNAYAKRPVAFYAVHCDTGLSKIDARRHSLEYGLRLPVLLDPEQVLARHVGATTTPEAAVLDQKGRVAYLGRIDDLYYGFGKRRANATQFDLRNAIDAVLAGRAVEQANVPAVGCEIPPPRPSR